MTQVLDRVHTRRPQPAAPTTPPAPPPRETSAREVLLEALLVGAVETVVFLAPQYAPDRIEFSPAIVDYIQRRAGELRLVLAEELLADDQVREYTEFLKSRGIVPRVLPEVPRRCAVIDRRLAVVEDKLVCDPTAVRPLVAASDQLWAKGRPLGSAVGRNVASRQSKVMELLAEGHTDEIVARRVGVSVRTVRGDVAAVMQEISASSRFQAGVQAARLGLL